MRQRVKKRKDKRIFKRTCKTCHPATIASMRGGIRL